MKARWFNDYRIIRGHKIRPVRLVRNIFFAHLVPNVVVLLFMASLLTVIFLAIHSQNASAQELLSTRPLTLPFATDATALQPFVFANNPALATMLNRPMLHCTLAPLRFGLRELSSAYILYASPIHAFEQSNGAFFTSLNVLGGTLYNELTASVGAAAQVSESIAVGVGVEYARIGIRDILPLQRLSWQFGASFLLSDWLTLGLAAHNLAPVSLGSRSESASSGQIGFISFGITALPDLLFDVGTVFWFNRTADSSSNTASALAIALSYEPLERLRVRFGVQGAPRQAEFGIRYSLTDIAIAVTAHFHESLGISQQIGISYSW